MATFAVKVTLETRNEESGEGTQETIVSETRVSELSMLTISKALHTMLGQRIDAQIDKARKDPKEGNPHKP